VDRLAGFVPAPKFVEEVARMRAGTRTLKSLRAAHAARPDDAGDRVAFARKLARTGERDAARLLLDPVAAASEPDVAALPGALLGLAEIANLEGDARRVDECLTRLLTQFPDAPEAADGWILRIDRLALVGAFDRAAQAAAEARRVVKGDEELARLEERLATFERLKFQATLLRWGERAEASGDLESLARAAKMALDRRLVLGTARRWAERVAKAAPDDIDAVEVYAALLFETGSMEMAIRTASEAVDATKDADVRARLSRRIAVWRVALDRPSPPSAPATPAAPSPPSDPPRSDPAALPRPPGDRLPPPLPPPPPTSPTEPKPPCR
jgi:tetratricopeptide (TPR) repeat protein